MSKKRPLPSGKARGELLYASRYHGFMQDLGRNAPFGVTVQSMDDPLKTSADFIWRAFGNGEVHILWAQGGQDIWEPGIFAKKVAALTRDVHGAQTAGLSVGVYMLLSRTKATAEAYSARQRELLDGGIDSCQQIVPVADEDDVVECLKNLVSKDLGYEGRTSNKKSKSKKNLPTLTERHDRPYDDRAVDALQKAIGGLGKKSARRLLTECGSLKAVADEGGLALQEAKFNATIATGVRKFMDARL